MKNSPASKFYMPTFRNIVCSETSAYKIQTPGNYPEESIQRNKLYSFLSLFISLVFFSYFVLPFLVFPKRQFALLSSSLLSLLRFGFYVWLFPSVLFYRFVVYSVLVCVSFLLIRYSMRLLGCQIRPSAIKPDVDNSVRLLGCQIRPSAI